VELKAVLGDKYFEAVLSCSAWDHGVTSRLSGTLIIESFGALAPGDNP
jgi:hypothetical protein